MSHLELRICRASAGTILFLLISLVPNLRSESCTVLSSKVWCGALVGSDHEVEGSERVRRVVHPSCAGNATEVDNSVNAPAHSDSRCRTSAPVPEAVSLLLLMRTFPLQRRKVRNAWVRLFILVTHIVNSRLKLLARLSAEPWRKRHTMPKLSIKIG